MHRDNDEVISNWNVHGWYFPERQAISAITQSSTTDEETSSPTEYLLKPCSSPTSSSSQNELVIFHFNDVYDLEENNAGDGGLPRFTTQLNEQRALYSDHLLLFSGDCFSPSRISSVTKGAHMIEAFNSLRVDCAVLGNHELDFGVDNFQQKSRESLFPWLCSNCWHKSNGSPLGGAAEAFITHKSGFKIGIIGLVEDLWLCSIKGLERDTLDYEDFVTAGRDMARALKQQHHCDVVVALTHMLERNDRRLAAEVFEIDLILGGHDHEYITAVVPPFGTRFVKSGTDFHSFSKITLTPRGASRPSFTTPLHVRVQRIDISSRNGSSCCEDVAMRSLCDKYAAMFEEQSKTILGHIAEGCRIDTREQVVRTSEANSGNWLCDILRDSVSRDILPEGCDIALINAGAIRANTVYDAGPFTLADLYSILPFTDQTIVKAATGMQLLEMLELSVNEWPEVSGFFLQVSGVKLVFDGSKPPFYSQDPTECLDDDFIERCGWTGRTMLSSVSIGGRPLDLKHKYTIIAPRFLEMKFPSFKAAETLLGPEASPYLKVALNNRLSPLVSSSGSNLMNRHSSPDSVHDLAALLVDQSNSRVRNVGVSFDNLQLLGMNGAEASGTVSASATSTTNRGTLIKSPIPRRHHSLGDALSLLPTTVAPVQCACCCSASTDSPFCDQSSNSSSGNSGDSDEYFIAEPPLINNSCFCMQMTEAAVTREILLEISAAVEGRLVNIAVTSTSQCASCD